MTSTTLKLVFIAMLSALLNGCAPISPSYAPVNTHYPDIAKDETKYHLVKKGDTLYAISLLFDLDYRKLAQWNQIAPPYRLEIGRKLRVSDPNLGNKPPQVLNGGDITTEAGEEAQRTEPLPTTPEREQVEQRAERLPTTARMQEVEQRREQLPRAMHEAQPATKPKIVIAPTVNRTGAQQKTAISLNNLTAQPPYKTPPLNDPAEKYGNSSQKKSIISIDNESMLKLNFRWPIKGKLLKAFSKTDNKGIDIAGEMGQDVSAAEAGKVVYSGQGLMGYGQLLIIKHNDSYLSAYANNSQLLVAEGYSVEKGQVIAKVGQAGSNKTSLHFEIRKNGKPVNPLNFLPKKH